MIRKPLVQKARFIASRSSLISSCFHSSATSFEWVKTKLTDRQLLSLSGENSMNFLQGLITNNVNKVEKDGQTATFTAFLTPPGRLQFDGFIYPIPDSHEQGLLIDHHSTQTESLKSWLQKFVLRSKVKINLDSRQVWAIWPSHSKDSLDQIISIKSLLNDPNNHSIWRKDSRGDQRLGFRSVVNPITEPDFAQEIPEAPLSAYTLHVLLHASLPPTLSAPYPISFPFEANLDYHQAIDFRKGCYVGQELTARTFHTGVIRKRLVVVALGESDHLDPTTLISPEIPESFSLLDTHLHPFIDNNNNNSSDQQIDLDLFFDKHSKTSKPIGKLCGPFISTTTIATHHDQVNHHEKERKMMFALALLRIDHQLFQSSSTWSSIQLFSSNFNRLVLPIKPIWWNNQS